MEVTFTAATLIALFAASRIRLFVQPNSRAQRKYLLYSVFGAVLFFAFWERSSFDAIINQGLLAATLIWLATGFMIGVGQEVTFRGLLYRGLRKYFGVAVAAALTTMVFVVAPIHSLRLIDYGQAGATDAVLILVPLYIAFGALFMWLRIETGSVLVPGLAHGVGNGHQRHGQANSYIGGHRILSRYWFERNSHSQPTTGGFAVNGAPSVPIIEIFSLLLMRKHCRKISRPVSRPHGKERTECQLQSSVRG